MKVQQDFGQFDRNCPKIKAVFAVSTSPIIFNSYLVSFDVACCCYFECLVDLFAKGSRFVWVERVDRRVADRWRERSEGDALRYAAGCAALCSLVPCAAVTHLCCCSRADPFSLFFSPTARRSRCGRRLCDADTRSWRTQRDRSRTPRMHSQRQGQDQVRTVRQADPRSPLLWAAPIATRTRPSTPATRAAPSDLPPAAAVVAAWVARRRLRSLLR